MTQRQLWLGTTVAVICFLAMIAVGVYSWKWLYQQPKEQGALKPLRTVLNKNEQIFKRTLNHSQLTKEYPKEQAVKKVRVNGKLGLKHDEDTLNWQLVLLKKDGDTLHISMNEIKALPRTEIVFDFKCVEGWSQVTHWGGVKFSDFMEHYQLDSQALMEYVSLVTPDKGYYVGIDMKSMLHPQTLLCYEMNGEPLPVNQGYPLRLIIPVKYGIKHIKRIGTISFSNERPRDYWFERGYDYFSGL